MSVRRSQLSFYGGVSVRGEGNNTILFSMFQIPNNVKENHFPVTNLLYHAIRALQSSPVAPLEVYYPGTLTVS